MKILKIQRGLIIPLVAVLASLTMIGSVNAAWSFLNPDKPTKAGDILIGKPIVNGNVFIEDEIIVRFKNDDKPFRVVKVTRGEVFREMKKFRQRKDVEYAEPNYVMNALLVPNDPYYSYQWHMDNNEYGGIGMEEAWDISTGQGVTVAIIDTGIAYENYGWSYKQAPDLSQTCFVPGYDFINNDSHPNDDNGHGTHVAGTVAQSTGNNTGVAGVAYSACLMPVKVLDQQGSGSYAAVAEGIRWAADHGAQIINLSLGGPVPSQAIEDAVAYAYNKGVIIIAATGNNSSGDLIYPAAYDNYVIAVGATRYDETLAFYSNYGPGLDLVAPGGDLGVDQNNDGYGDGVLQQSFSSSGWQQKFDYYFMMGTSMAAPHVAGTAALVIANGNADTPDEVRAALEETAKDLGASGRDNTYGNGLVNALAALGWTPAPSVNCSSDSECGNAGGCVISVCVNPGTVSSYCASSTAPNGAACDDGLFCTMDDVCAVGICEGAARDCSDSVGCTADSCDEEDNICVNSPENSFCDNGLYCDGIEICNAVLGCQIGVPAICDDGEDCTIDACNDDIDACEYMWPSCGLEDGCCGPDCGGADDADCITAIMCWDGNNEYLYKNNQQAKKFCKCASGVYGYNGYSYTSWGKQTVYKYVSARNNENWETVSASSRSAVYKVGCKDGIEYYTNQNYYSQ